MKLNSIIFHTTDIKSIRSFYEDKLGFKIGSYEKNGEQVVDCSDVYVNYNLNGTLFCFEFEDGRCDLGTVVINVKSLIDFKSHLDHLGVKTVGDVKRFLKIKDPDGRTLIIEEDFPSTSV